MTGQLVGPYRVLDKIGSGGMGDVYLAEDTRLGRRVALKKPSADWLALPSARARLHREASAAALLTHPHIAAIYDVIDDGTAPYIVMEYVEGDSLAALLGAGRIPVERAVAIGIQLADALAAAHAKGIVHRDLKPGNVCLTPDGQAKVLDFGLASARMPSSAAPAAAQKLTVPGQFLGTPGYASPEQLAGSAGSPSDDIYSLGVLLFELLTGRRPFEADNALDLAVATMTRTAPTADSLNPAVPPILSALVARALARNAQDRVASAAHFGSALRDVAEALAGSPTRALPSLRRGRRQTVVVAATSLLAVASVVVGLWLTRTSAPVEATGVPVVAVLPFTTHSGEPDDQGIASGVRDVLIADLGRRPGINVLSRTATMEADGSRDDRDAWARDLGATLLVDGSLQRANDQLRVAVELVHGRDVVWSAVYSASERDVFSLQERIASGLAGSPPLRAAAGPASGPASAGTQDLEASALYGQAVDLLDRPDVRSNVDRAVTLLRAALDRDRRFALAWARFGEAQWELYDLTREPKYTDEARAAITEALRLDPDQPLVRLSLARIYLGTGRTEEAIEELNEAIARQPDSDHAHQLRGQALQRAGRTEEAEAAYTTAIDLRPNYWRNHSMLGALHFGAGRYPDALASFTRVTALQPDNARGFHNAATIYYHMGDHENALAYYEKAIAVSPLAPMAESYSGAGTIYYQQGRHDAAAHAFQRAIALSPNNGLLHGNLGDALMRLNRPQEARKAYREAVRLDHQRLSVNPKEAAVLARVAVIEAKLGLRSDAERHVAAAVSLTPGEGEVLFRSAVVRALNGDTAGALAALEQALERGYSSTIAKNDHDLASIRGTAGYQKIMSAY